MPKNIKNNKSATVSNKQERISFKTYFSLPYSIPLYLTFILVIIFSVRMVSGFDIGFHLSGGRYITENFSFPFEDTFTYTVTGNEYIDIQWLFQLINFIVYKISGYDGLTVLNVMLMVFVFILILKRLMMKNLPVIYSVVSLLLTIIAVQIRISNRPEVFTWIFILLTLIILDNYFLFKSKKLFFLPLILLLWVNSHGLFIIGLFLIICYYISIFIQSGKNDTYLLKWFLISAAVCFINPYFADGVLFPFYLFTRLQSSNIFKNSISELGSPLGLINDFPFDIYLYISIAVLSLILIIFTFRKRKFHEIAILLAFLYLSFTSYRNLPLFLIYAVYIITVSAHDIISNAKSSRFRKDSNAAHYISSAISLVIVLICVRVITGAYYADYKGAIIFGTGVNNNTLPDKLSEHMNANNVSGHMINQFELGGWLHWKTGQPVFIDGRLEVMKEDFFEEYNKSFKVNGLRSLSQMFNPSLIIYNHSTAYSWTDEIRKLDGWNIIYLDGFFAAYSKNFEIAKSEIELLTQYIKDNKLDSGLTKNSALKLLDFNPVSGTEKFIRGFYTKQNYYSELVSLGNFALQNQNFNETEIFYFSYLEKTKNAYLEEYHADVFTNLGNIYMSKKYYENALKCFENVLKIYPDNEQVNQKVGELKQIIRTIK